MKRLLLLPIALALPLAGCGGSDDAPSAGGAGGNRRIDVVMTDMAFSPSTVDVAAGETITFVFRNDGAVRHEAAIGDLAAQEAHHAEMAAGAGHDGMDMGSMPAGTGGEHEMEGGMSELHGVLVEPGATLELTHTFDEAGPTMIGCHEPGHWEAGMKMDVAVG